MMHCGAPELRNIDHHAFSFDHLVVRQTSSCVPAVPKSATPTSGLLRRSKGQPLFDHLVGAGEQIDASFKTESST